MLIKYKVRWITRGSDLYPELYKREVHVFHENGPLHMIERAAMAAVETFYDQEENYNFIVTDPRGIEWSVAVNVDWTPRITAEVPVLFISKKKDDNG
jgi:hypothetical protein